YTAFFMPLNTADEKFMLGIFLFSLRKWQISDIILPIMSNNVKKALIWAIESLKGGGIENPQLDAEVLLAYVLDTDRTQLYLYPETILDEEKSLYYKILTWKRQSHIPVSYLTGHKEFMSLDFKVNESVLVPRPETEILVEAVIKSSASHSKIFDLGTGSGAIAISLAKYIPDCLVLATDLSLEALMIARENAVINGVNDKILFGQTDLFDAILPNFGFDYIVSNPPYIPTDDIKNLSDEVRKFEPTMAIDGGIDGLDIIRKILGNAFVLLKPSGRLAIEIGYGQSDEVQRIAEETEKYSDYAIIEDYSRIPRVFYCRAKI
ncbi:MAG: peptide chain release factor N(5)-glutamine methyltransferase, partial [Candidatus Poribacteria bacterium]